MKNDAPDFGNPWSDEDGSSGGFAPSPEFENPWADASGTGDATGAGVGATATTTGSDSAGSPDNGESSSAASKVPAILLAIALVIVGAWALSSNSSANEEIEYLERENSRLSAEAKKVPELESEIRSLESDASDADSLEQRLDELSLLFNTFGFVNPCSITGFGTAKSTHWTNSPELGFGCAYFQNNERTLVVTIGTDDADPEDQAITVDGVKGYMLSRTRGQRTIFVWAPGSESAARKTASDVLDDLVDLGMG